MEVNIYAQITGTDNDSTLTVYRGDSSEIITLKFLQGAITINASEIEKALARFKKFDNEETSTNG